MIQISKCYIIHAAQDSCLTTNGSGLPIFQGYDGEDGGADRRIHHQHQAIIPSYKFNCCGNITEWGVDLNPDRDGVNQTFNFILQVWRPSPTLQTECYSLVNDHSITSTSIGKNSQTGRVAKVTPLPHNQQQFEPGDALGFYVESHGSRDSNDDNGVVVLNDGSHTSELVWHGSIDITARTSQSGSCPYPIGTNGVLNTSTNAAPVISISAVMVTTCLSSNMHSSSALLNSLTSTTSRDLTILMPTVPFISPSTSPQHVTTPGSSDGIIDNVLIIGIVIVVPTFVIASTIIIIIIIVVMKRQSGKKQADNVVMALSNQLYGKSASCALCHDNVFLF